MNLVTRFKAAKAAATAAVVGSLFAANAAMAQAAGGQLDLSQAQTQVLGYVALTVAFIVAVGTAVLGLVMVAKAVRWARKAG
ncbi:MAG: hypothetical protein O9303_01375 [Silanimonas sp.]|nr:hypothetical protein [Silanimonas sp.]